MADDGAALVAVDSERERALGDVEREQRATELVAVIRGANEAAIESNVFYQVLRDYIGDAHRMEDFFCDFSTGESDVFAVSEYFRLETSLVCLLCDLHFPQINAEPFVELLVLLDEMARYARLDVEGESGEDIEPPTKPNEVGRAVDRACATLMRMAYVVSARDETPPPKELLEASTRNSQQRLKPKARHEQLLLHLSEWHRTNGERSPAPLDYLAKKMNCSESTVRRAFEGSAAPDGYPSYVAAIRENNAASLFLGIHVRERDGRTVVDGVVGGESE